MLQIGLGFCGCNYKKELNEPLEIMKMMPSDSGGKIELIKR
jgi:hypothetical protein